MKKKQLIKMKCDKCGIEQKPDRAKSVPNWLVYDAKAKCSCGGRFKPDIDLPTEKEDAELVAKLSEEMGGVTFVVTPDRGGDQKCQIWTNNKDYQIDAVKLWNDGKTQKKGGA